MCAHVWVFSIRHPALSDAALLPWERLCHLNLELGSPTASTITLLSSQVPRWWEFELGSSGLCGKGCYPLATSAAPDFSCASWLSADMGCFQGNGVSLCTMMFCRLEWREEMGVCFMSHSRAGTQPLSDNGLENLTHGKVVDICILGFLYHIQASSGCLYYSIIWLNQLFQYTSDY